MNALLGLRGGFDSNPTEMWSYARVAMPGALAYMVATGNQPEPVA